MLFRSCLVFWVVVVVGIWHAIPKLSPSLGGFPQKGKRSKLPMAGRGVGCLDGVVRGAGGETDQESSPRHRSEQTVVTATAPEEGWVQLVYGGKWQECVCVCVCVCVLCVCSVCMYAACVCVYAVCVCVCEIGRAHV